MNFSTLISKSVELINQHAPSVVRQYNQASRMDLVVIGAATAMVLYNLRSMVANAKTRHLNLPPKVAYSLPLLGHTLYMVVNANKFLDWCVANYGDTFDLDILGKTVTVAGGSIAEQAMKEDGDKLSLEHGVLTGMELRSSARIGLEEHVVMINSRNPSCSLCVQQGNILYWFYRQSCHHQVAFAAIQNAKIHEKNHRVRGIWIV
jgi:hypothetical protein